LPFAAVVASPFAAVVVSPFAAVVPSSLAVAAASPFAAVIASSLAVAAASPFAVVAVLPFALRIAASRLAVAALVTKAAVRVVGEVALAASWSSDTTRSSLSGSLRERRVAVRVAAAAAPALVGGGLLAGVSGAWWYGSGLAGGVTALLPVIARAFS
jgi:hypothetical protein